MAINQIVIDADGDLTVIFPQLLDNTTPEVDAFSSSTTLSFADDFEEAGGEEPEVDTPATCLILSSKHMVMASSVFKAMLDGRVEATLDDDLEAFTILANLIHGKALSIPLKVTLDMLLRLAVLVDKYKLREVTGVVSRLWMDNLLPILPTDYTTAAVMVWLAISWVFRE
jgi:hypothetical protein